MLEYVSPSDFDLNGPWTYFLLIASCDRVSPNGPNVARFCDHAYDALFARQAESEDHNARVAAFGEMQHSIAASAVFVPLVYRGDYSAINPAVRGW